jgi:hypothetical protein
VVKTISIDDAELIGRVERVRRKTGDRSIARTASRLLIERLAQLGITDSFDDADRGVETVPPSDGHDESR